MSVSGVFCCCCFFNKFCFEAVLLTERNISQGKYVLLLIYTPVLVNCQYLCRFFFPPLS